MKDMNEIEKLYQNQVEYELKKIENSKSQVLNKDKVDQKILAFLSELGKVGEESQCFSFWDKSTHNKEEILSYYVDGLQLLLSIGFELQIESLKNYTEIPTPDTLLQQFIKVYEGVLKIHHSYTFEDYQNSVDDYLTLGFKLGLTFDEILTNYKDKI